MLQAGWTLIRDDLGLAYAQIGLLLSVSYLVANLVEPFLGILADAGKRRVLVLAGGLCYALGMLLVALSPGFPILMVSFVLLAPATGGFVSLSQGALMDADLAGHERNMARWTVAASLGFAAGPLALGGAVLLGAGWRGLFVVFAVVTAILTVLVIRLPLHHWENRLKAESLGVSLRAALAALRRWEVWRWLVLLQFSDMMLEVLPGFLALYMHDVVGATVGQAGLAVLVWSVSGVVGEFAVLRMLERVRGLSYLRVSAVVLLVAYPAFLLVPGLWPKLVLVALLSLLNSGWYPIIQGQVYSSLPGRSGTALALGNLAGLFGGMIPLVVGLVAERLDLRAAMWLLAIGPLVLLVGVFRRAAHQRGRQV